MKQTFALRWLIGAVLLAAVCLSLGPAHAEDVGDVVNTQQGTPPSAEEAAGLITVPDGFNVTLFAGEPDVRQPIAACTDERGRLWVAENYTYAEAAVGFDMSLHDRILILDDTDHDGRFDKRTVFWDSGERITSVEVGFGGVWVLAAPQLLFIPDRNHDDVPDGPPEVVLDGWDTDSIRHNIVNGLRWGPDGWLYGRHGILANSFIGKPGAAPSQRVELNCSIWRYHPTKEIFEVVAHGGTNSWGFDYDQHGQMFFINTVIGHLWHLIPGAHYRRMYGADFNPNLYELIEQTADHFHWDTGEKWSDIRAGVSDTTAAAGGGHAHSGLMIYQGDNWPAEYRHRMYTLNFHGHRINADELEREEAGYVGHHGEDFLFANNEWFRGLDLISGPDGGVFIVDWSDIGECHDNDGIHRTSGRIYKVTYGQPESPSPADLSKLTPLQLVRLQRHPNTWHVRQARRLLQELAVGGGPDLSPARQALLDMFNNETDAVLQLRALWCLSAINGVDEEWLRQQVAHPNEHVRLWAIRLLTDTDDVSQETADALAKCAETESSGLVRLYLASALQRLAFDQRWPIAAELVLHEEDATDKALPLMIWYGIEGAVPANPQAALSIAEASQIPLVRRHIARRLTADLEANPEAVNAVVRLLGSHDDPAFQLDVLQGMNDALRGWRQAPMPESWSETAEPLLASKSADVRQQAQQLGIVFGDGRAMDALLEIAADAEADTPSRRSALQSLVADRAPEALSLLKQLLGDVGMSNEVVRGFAAYDDPAVPRLILDRYPRLDPEGQTTAIDTLTSRASYATALLAAVEAGQLPSTAITAYHARQMRSLQDPALQKELERLWGAIRETSSEKQAQLAELHAMLGASPGDADRSEGRRLFDKSCASCHVLFGSGGRIGPDLTGSNRSNLTYLLENIVDPSASVNKDFKVSTIVFNDGRVVTGVVVEANDRTVTVQTQKERLIVNRADVDEIAGQDASLMPDGLLKPLSEADIRNLLAYLASPSQVPLPED